MLVKEKYKDSKETSIKVHVSCYPFLAGFYTAEELIKWYGDCECEDISYEKDYGEGMPAIRSYLLIHTDKNYDKEIMKERKNNEIHKN